MATDDIMDEHNPPQNDLSAAQLAKTFHLAWCEWSQAIAETENISDERLQRWEKYWETDWEQLDADVQQYDFEYAEQYLDGAVTVDWEQLCDGEWTPLDGATND